MPVLSIVLYALGALFSILGIILGLHGMISLYRHYRLGSSRLPFLDPLPVYASNNSEDAIPPESWGAVNVTFGDPEFFEIPLQDAIPFRFDPDLESFRPTCYTCNRGKASFLYSNMCFYMTNYTASFEECFTICRNFSPCYYFFYPTLSFSAIIRSNMKSGETFWVGGFKTVKSQGWVDIYGSPVSVVDIYGSYCSYISKLDTIPRSYYYCNFPRHCLCAGVSSFRP